MRVLSTDDSKSLAFQRLALALALPIIVRGAGAYSVDAAIANRRALLTPHAVA